MYLDERNTSVAEAPVVPKLEPWQELLLLVAQCIRERGWCQFHDKNDKGEVCLRGAFNEARHAAPTYECSTRSTAWARVQNCIGPNFSVTSWNDDPSRTKEQVINLVESVAKSG